MFRRLVKDLPPDAFFPANLSKLGFMINEAGQFVDTIQGKFFSYFKSDQERTNDVHREALHDCKRDAVMEALADLGITQLHCYKNGFGEIKPNGPHVTILATDLESLWQKKDVIVVIGEHTQDQGIWAYRVLSNEGGIDDGSAVGLAKKLQAWGAADTSKDVDKKDFVKKDLNTANKNDANKVTGADADLSEKFIEELVLNDEYVKITEFTDDTTPGLIVLNPGQLIYSNELNKCMTQATWLARPQKDALTPAYTIDPIYNRVDGHKTPEEHISTVFEQVIPKITRSNAKLYLVGITDGAEAVLTYIDAKLKQNPADPIGTKLEAIALMQPSHDPAKLQSAVFSGFLTQRGRSYVFANKPKGTLVGAPWKYEPTFDTISVQDYAKDPAGRRRDREGSVSSTSKPIPLPSPYLHPIRDQDVAQSVSTSLETYDYTKDKVSCPTYSAGSKISVGELIWPAVMNDVLAYFKQLAEARK